MHTGYKTHNQDLMAYCKIYHTNFHQNRRWSCRRIGWFGMELPPDTSIISVGLIGAEIWAFDHYRLTHLGQDLSKDWDILFRSLSACLNLLLPPPSLIFDPYLTKHFKNLRLFFFSDQNLPYQFSSKSQIVMSDFISKLVDLAWNYLSAIYLLLNMYMEW